MLDRFMIQLVMLALWICLGEAILLCLIILVRYWFGFNRAHVTDYHGRYPDEQRYTIVLVLFCAVGFLIFLPFAVKLMFGM